MLNISFALSLDSIGCSTFLVHTYILAPVYELKSKWNVVHDCDTEDGKPTCWAKRIDHQTYGQFVWISEYSDNQFAVEVIPVTETKVLATCKSLTSAKQWVAINIG